MRAEVDLKRDIIAVGKMLHAKGYIAATDGNISIKVSPNRILTTASGVSKGFLKDEHIVVVDADGNLISGRHNPSSELKMHLVAYKLRPELKAIVHGHPPTCTAFTIAGVTLAKCVLPEVVMTLGTIPTADYATPTTGEVPESIRDFITQYDAVLLDRHGAITVSKSDVFDAYYKLEKIEHTAEVTLKARQLGNVKTLSGEQIEKLTGITGIDKDKLCSDKCVNCGACGRHAPLSRAGAVVGDDGSAGSNVASSSNEASSCAAAGAAFSGGAVVSDGSSVGSSVASQNDVTASSIEAIIREEVEKALSQA